MTVLVCLKHQKKNILLLLLMITMRSKSKDTKGNVLLLNHVATTLILIKLLQCGWKCSADRFWNSFRSTVCVQISEKKIQVHGQSGVFSAQLILTAKDAARLECGSLLDFKSYFLSYSKHVVIPTCLRILRNMDENWNWQTMQRI